MRPLHLVLIAAAAAVLTAGCTSTPRSSPSSLATLTGRAFTTSCPSQATSGQTCDYAFKGSLAVCDPQSQGPCSIVSVDGHGNFVVTLPPGNYVIQPEPATGNVVELPPSTPVVIGRAGSTRTDP